MTFTTSFLIMASVGIVFLCLCPFIVSSRISREEELEEDLAGALEGDLNSFLHPGE